MRTVNKKVLKVPKDRAQGDMQRFYRSLDLAALWTTFYVSIGPSGRPQFTSAKQYARHVATNDKQYEFLAWLFGPGGDSELDKLYDFAGPALNFEDKRKTGGWFTEENLKEHSRDIRNKINALEALRSAGNGITIHSLARMERLAKQLDEDFGGRFLVEGLSLKDNMLRARTYLMMHDKLLNLIGYAQDIYAKSHGINFQDMSGFERLIAAQSLVLASGGDRKHERVSNVLSKIVDMALEKSAKHGLPLPADVESTVVIDAGKAKKKEVTM